ncbi:putative metalloprotease CJM1_0395 family protein [Magnetospirillum gryphiswaldense]|uniref:putative metalloprotease CJM1_0395 family protein n=1 Tax=Magnetospirillum gryphiswaldense TaxID=55518 RepID=UPI0003268E9B|nr:putative metalloprotease CJM1_0395 family protein [Magnetospirillum gryphiswaldense]AVM73648.1 SprA-related family protein [Magnetospirillum gryphiswaldense MSR-1]AVM77551.1 SprA-related family protein [Magnetospirillum gryphiswaldense]
MSAIGSVIATPHGPARILTIMPGAQTEAGQQVSRVLTTPLSQAGTQAAGEGDLSQAERQQLKQLQDADRAVKTEERHHAAVAGAYGGAPQYQYVQGPDGKYYAVAGKVEVGAPANASDEEAARAHKAIAAAATSVASPSSADYTAAAQASRQASKAYGRFTAGDGRGSLFDFSG